ncbi:MAG: hypothetical protein HKN82_06755 [Akkermansiaceae bacterium]|nr:hypothetical protein [Akkermansiaceae bacterium]
MTKRLTVVVIALAGCFGPPGKALAEPVAAVPAEFDYVGTYRLVKRVKLRHAEVFPVAIRPVDYRVYTDGITLRLYGSQGDGGHTSFTIYRNDGIVQRHSDSVVETVPGIQAQSLVGQVLRQVCLTELTLTLNKIPALSDVLEVTYGRRLLELPRPQDPLAAQIEE